MRPTISKLSDEMINLISAGEVVERPMSVVKELVENSIDAGSSNIEVELTEGGIKKIRVIDNGIGMKKDEILFAINAGIFNTKTNRPECVLIRNKKIFGQLL